MPSFSSIGAQLSSCAHGGGARLRGDFPVFSCVRTQFYDERRVDSRVFVEPVTKSVGTPKRVGRFVSGKKNMRSQKSRRSLALARPSFVGLASIALIGACSTIACSSSSPTGISEGAPGRATAGSAGHVGTATGGNASSSGGGGTTGSGGAAGTSSASGGATIASGDASAGSGQTPPMIDAGAAMPVGDQSFPRKLTIENHCTYDIWNFAQPASTFPGNVPYKLASGDAIVVGWPDKWSGRIWPRSECTGDPGKLTCAQTGNDTLAEFTLTAGMNSDWYDISLVDGFTIPTGIIQLDAPWIPSPSYVPGGPLGADQQCGSPICAVDLNLMCPAAQQMKDTAGKVVGCKNGQSSNGGHGPTDVTSYMKKGCPTSYTYPYDDPQSLFICPSAVQNGGHGSKDYKIIYCPTQGSTPGFP